MESVFGSFNYSSQMEWGFASAEPGSFPLSSSVLTGSSSVGVSSIESIKGEVMSSISSVRIAGF